jgi:hypothetical protein
MQPEDVKKQMYHCDVVYGTTSEFGFDYLRDNMKRPPRSRCSAARLRDRRRGGLDPHRRGADAADHLRPGPRRQPALRAGRPSSPAPVEKQRSGTSRRQGQSCKRDQGLEGDIRNVRDKSKVPEPCSEARGGRRSSCPNSRPSATSTRSTTRSRWSARAPPDARRHRRGAARRGHRLVLRRREHRPAAPARAGDPRPRVYERDRDYVVDVPTDDGRTSRAS